ncbi:MAG TPA: HAD hydrolase-like protein [Streptosporangiaceae bacterium]|nr:HAD hydrolase-like protein [Streptosporangiaceae bacterium]
MASSVLVLWDVDYTLLRAGRVGPALYRLALQEMFECDLPTMTVAMAGRTDRAIAVDVLLAAGIADPRAVLDQFQAVLARHAPALAGQVATYGRVLPGVREALAAVAAGRPGVRVVQSALTGNLRAMAEVKLAALGLTEYLDVDAGAYGEQSEVRADLVPVARRNAAARYGADFSGEATVLVGDTPLDIEAALAAGARAVGVATGSFTLADLQAAGAHAALPDLTDLAAAVAAILP